MSPLMTMVPPSELPLPLAGRRPTYGIYFEAEPRYAKVSGIVVSVLASGACASFFLFRVAQVKSWRSLAWTHWLLLAIYFDSYLFVMASTVLHYSFSLNDYHSLCEAATLLCLLAYLSSKYTVWGSGVSRCRSKPYLIHFAVLTGHELAKLTRSHRCSRFSRMENGLCIIGIQQSAMIGPVAVDVACNAYLTAVFTYPIYRYTVKGSADISPTAASGGTRTRSERLLRVAKKSFAGVLPHAQQQHREPSRSNAARRRASLAMPPLLQDRRHPSYSPRPLLTTRHGAIPTRSPLQRRRSLLGDQHRFARHHRHRVPLQVRLGPQPRHPPLLLHGLDPRQHGPGPAPGSPLRYPANIAAIPSSHGRRRRRRRRQRNGNGGTPFSTPKANGRRAFIDTTNNGGGGGVVAVIKSPDQLHPQTILPHREQRPPAAVYEYGNDIWSGPIHVEAAELTAGSMISVNEAEGGEEKQPDPSEKSDATEATGPAGTDDGGAK
ncbi:hypothetical protein PG991_000613 [Apiospora marii]|uniref:Uncharacterized protein n=1 Tax=Apiospora marii TaxID=335849 RepID=A0ABR1SSS3_9PEZI